MNYLLMQKFGRVILTIWICFEGSLLADSRFVWYDAFSLTTRLDFWLLYLLGTMLVWLVLFGWGGQYFGLSFETDSIRIAQLGRRVLSPMRSFWFYLQRTILFFLSWMRNFSSLSTKLNLSRPTKWRRDEMECETVFGPIESDSIPIDQLVI